MADFDTSKNTWNPSPTHDELMAIRDRMNARLAAGEPVNLIRVANLRTKSWRQDIGFLSVQRRMSRTAPEVRACINMARTGEHLGLEFVGRVLREEPVNG